MWSSSQCLKRDERRRSGSSDGSVLTTGGGPSVCEDEEGQRVGRKLQVLGRRQTTSSELRKSFIIHHLQQLSVQLHRPSTNHKNICTLFYWSDQRRRLQTSKQLQPQNIQFNMRDVFRKNLDQTNTVWSEGSRTDWSTKLFPCQSIDNKSWAKLFQSLCFTAAELSMC